jgi:hypothetical protein
VEIPDLKFELFERLFMSYLNSIFTRKRRTNHSAHSVVAGTGKKPKIAIHKMNQLTCLFRTLKEAFKDGHMTHDRK